VRLEPVGGTGRLDAVFLLAHAGGVSRQEMIAHRERKLDARGRRGFRMPSSRAGKPAHRSHTSPGEAGFYGRMFAVDERVLVPRPETELAVEWAVRHLRAIGREAGTAADVGTGSGAIAVTLALASCRISTCLRATRRSRRSRSRAPTRRATTCSST
jgi:release factor glutamine methyltransferase